MTEVKEIGPYTDVLVEVVIKDLKQRGFQVEAFRKDGDRLSELRLRLMKDETREKGTSHDRAKNS